MAVPKYNEMFLSMLKSLIDGKIHSIQEMRNYIAQDMKISTEDLSQMLDSGRVTVFSDRVSWSRTYLKKAGLIESVRRGYYQLTEEGKRVATNPPPVLDKHFLCRYPSFCEFLHRTPSSNRTQITLQETVNTVNEVSDSRTPRDIIEQSLNALNQNLADDLLKTIMEQSETFFEQLVVKLLLRMGYGGPDSDSGYVTQRSNDEGIDGIIREDKLGFEQIYIQAKRWDPNRSIDRPELQKFSGALRDKGASKGLFITTAKFSKGAQESAEKQHIVLVDGTRLTKLMIEYNLGVSPVMKYEIKAIDSDFFNEDTE